jgi:hypothetical protein
VQFTYILIMRSVNRIIVLFLLLGFTGIQLVSLLDDPQHLTEPDPDCPLCLAAKTEVCTAPSVAISFTPEIILFLTDQTPFDQGNGEVVLYIPIRAPPYS